MAYIQYKVLSKGYTREPFNLVHVPINLFILHRLTWTLISFHGFLSRFIWFISLYMYPVVSACIYLDVLFIHRYEFILTSKQMFKIVGKRFNTSLNIETGMSKQIQTVQGQQCFPFCQYFCDKLVYSQITESYICLIYFFSGNCSRDGIW